MSRRLFSPATVIALALSTTSAFAESVCLNGDVEVRNDAIIKGDVIKRGNDIVCPDGTTAVVLGTGTASTRDRNGGSATTTGKGSPIISGSGNQVTITVDGRTRQIKN